MLTDTKTRKHRSASRYQTINRSPSSKKVELPKRKHRSPTRKQTDSIKLTKDEIKYQRFIHGLKKDIRIYLNTCLRESCFDPSGNQDRTKQTNKIFNSMKSLPDNETKRLSADVQAILTGPPMKIFYTEYIQLQKDKFRRLRSLEESILWSNEQE